MKKLFLLLLLPIILFTACSEEENPVDNTPTTGKIFVTSAPTGATIYLAGTNTGKVTPDTLNDLQPGVYTVKLVKANYVDTSYTVSVAANTTETINITMKEDFKGNLLLKSTPVGAQIWLDGVNTGKVTPDTLKNLPVGNKTVSLKLANYIDTTFVAQVMLNQTETYDIALNPVAVKFGPIRLYETLGTTAAQPSGLDLSSGNAYGISSTNKNDVDVYYSSTGFLVKSATATSLPRQTWFKVGAGTVLTDGVDSPLKDATWGESMGDRETNYVFLLDNDGNYSKIKIVGFGGGVPGVPAYIDVEYYYQTKAGNRDF